MKIFLTPDAERPFTIPGTDVVWFLGAIPSPVAIYFSEKYHSDIARESVGHSAGFVTDLVRHGLRRVEGLDGAEVPLVDILIPYVGTFKGVDDAFINRLPPTVIAALAAEIMSDVFVTAAERKNS